ncbi:MAG: helix-turn-helix transcriptional regulator [Tepidisphaeraceae bacterium]|jgi:ribosome-binding protein aMBF1 (putative translation factor)
MMRSRNRTTARQQEMTPVSWRSRVDLLDPILGNARRLRELNARLSLDAMVARLIFDSRVNAGLNQGQLAERIGSRQPAISRVENGIGHTPRMLNRIFKALGHHLEWCLSQTKGDHHRKLERIVKEALAVEPKKTTRSR